MAGPARYRFRCAACGEAVQVGGEGRRALREAGCVFCGTPVSLDATGRR